jgi:hypothetical protein
MATKFFALGFVVLLSGCAGAPVSQNDLKNASYGSPISTQQMEDLIRKNSGLFDPYSAVIQCSAPRKGYTSFLTDSMYGMISICTTNAKNRMGGYTGEQVDAYIMTNKGVFRKAYHGYITYAE